MVTSKKSLTNNGKTKKQSPNERKGGSLRKNANWKRGNSTIRYWVQTNGYQEGHWAHRELPETTVKLEWTHCKLYQHEKEIETINKGQEETKNTISELKNTVEGIKSRLHEAEDRTSKLEDKVEKKTHRNSKKRKRGSERMKR